jgi:hypothetical protein
MDLPIANWGRLFRVPVQNGNFAGICVAGNLLKISFSPGLGGRPLGGRFVGIGSKPAVVHLPRRRRAEVRVHRKATTMKTHRIIAGALLAAGVAVAGMGLGVGTAQASPGDLRWCPGDPPPKALQRMPDGSTIVTTVNPAWDTNVCHDYVMREGQVGEGLSCPLPQIQWSQCPPGRTPAPLIPLVPNR